MKIEVSPAQGEDDAFLFAVYASTRANEMALVPWTEEQKDAFLRMQSQLQRSHYATHFPKAEYNLILFNSQPIGRLFINRDGDEIHILDIALLPEYRGRGIGTELIRTLQEEGQARELPVTLYVEQFNPARQLYERMGFALISTEGIYSRMAWQPLIKEQPPPAPRSQPDEMDASETGAN